MSTSRRGFFGILGLAAGCSRKPTRIIREVPRAAPIIGQRLIRKPLRFVVSTREQVERKWGSEAGKIFGETHYKRVDS